jgi:hypothetical protein
VRIEREGQIEQEIEELIDRDMLGDRDGRIDEDRWRDKEKERERGIVGEIEVDRVLDRG